MADCLQFSNFNLKLQYFICLILFPRLQRYLDASFPENYVSSLVSFLEIYMPFPGENWLSLPACFASRNKLTSNILRESYSSYG